MDALADIAVFVRVVERGSFTLAADDLGLSRAVVSKYLSRLEERLGARLLHRTCLLYTSPSPRDGLLSRMPSSA